MEALRTEDEQVQALKKWWDENGRSLVIGVVLGLGAIGGWKAWQDHKLGQSLQASVAFEQMLQSVALGEAAVDPALRQGEAIKQQFPDTPYATLSSLAMAGIQLRNGDLAAARSNLQWVIDNSVQQEMKDLARMRLVRLAMQEGALDEAASLLGTVPPTGFDPLFHELRGDLLREQGDFQGAGDAYQQALNANSPSRALVKMKLDELGLADADEAP